MLLLLLLLLLLVMLLSRRGHQELLRMRRLEKVLGPHGVVTWKLGQEGLGLELVLERIGVVDCRWLRWSRRETRSVQKPSLV